MTSSRHSNYMQDEDEEVMMKLMMMTKVSQVACESTHCLLLLLMLLVHSMSSQHLDDDERQLLEATKLARPLPSDDLLVQVKIHPVYCREGEHQDYFEAMNCTCLQMH